jgi:beta-lactamase class D
MKTHTISLLLIALILTPLSFTWGETQERKDWGHYFKEFEAQGTIVVVDQRSSESNTMVYNGERADQRYSPASTFKIPHALFALDASILRDEFQVFTWDGIERSYAPHNQDQTLRSAMRHSAVWVFSLLAQEIGADNAQQYLNKINYGNTKLGIDVSTYWLDGSLQISAQEQIDFLMDLYANKLPFHVDDQRLVKDVMINEAGSNWILRAKTGWTGQMGWWVGWVEWPEGPVFFALNIDTPNRLDDLHKRKDITKNILRSIKALPADK